MKVLYSLEEQVADLEKQLETANETIEQINLNLKRTTEKLNEEISQLKKSHALEKFQLEKKMTDDFAKIKKEKDTKIEELEGVWAEIEPLRDQIMRLKRKNMELQMKKNKATTLDSEQIGR